MEVSAGGVESEGSEFEGYCPVLDIVDSIGEDGEKHDFKGIQALTEGEFFE